MALKFKKCFVVKIFFLNGDVWRSNHVAVNCIVLICVRHKAYTNTYLPAPTQAQTHAHAYTRAHIHACMITHAPIDTHALALLDNTQENVPNCSSCMVLNMNRTFPLSHKQRALGIGKSADVKDLKEILLPKLMEIISIHSDRISELRPLSFFCLFPLS